MGSIPGSGRSPGGGMATHSSILAWRIPRTEEPGGLQSTGSQGQTRLSHSACTNLCVNSQLLMDPLSLTFFFVFISISFFSLFLCLFLLGKAVRLCLFLDSSHKWSPLILTSPCLPCFSRSDHLCFLLSDWTWHFLPLAHGWINGSRRLCGPPSWPAHLSWTVAPFLCPAYFPGTAVISRVYVCFENPGVSLALRPRPGWRVLRRFCVWFSKGPPCSSPSCMDRFPFPAVVREGSLPSTPCPAFTFGDSVRCPFSQDGQGIRC